MTELGGLFIVGRREDATVPGRPSPRIDSLPSLFQYIFIGGLLFEKKLMMTAAIYLVSVNSINQNT